MRAFISSNAQFGHLWDTPGSQRHTRPMCPLLHREEREMTCHDKLRAFLCVWLGDML